MTTTRVVIVEDHPVFRDGLESALGAQEDIEVLASVGTLADAQRVLSDAPADVVLLDLGLPDGSGLDVLSTLRARHAATVAIVLTMNDDPQVVLSAVRAGARGYLLKGAGRDEIVEAVRRAADGGVIFHRGAADVVVRALTQPAMPDVVAGLTPREADVLRLVADDLTNAAIAQRLGISAKTVRNQVSAVLAKVGAPTRQAAAEWARQSKV